MSNIPAWFWIIYYTFFATTFFISVLAVIRRRNRWFSIINLIIVVTVPFVSIINTMGIIAAANEFIHLMNHLRQGDLWAVYVWAGYLFILIWWVWFIKDTVRGKKVQLRR